MNINTTVIKWEVPFLEGFKQRKGTDRLLGIDAHDLAQFILDARLKELEDLI